MAERELNYVASAEDASEILLDLMHTPMLRNLRFTFKASFDSIPVVEYCVERFVYEETKIEPVLDKNGQQTGEFQKVRIE